MRNVTWTSWKATCFHVKDYVWRKENVTLQHKNLMESVKHGGSSIVAWARFVASSPGRLAITDGTMNSECYQQSSKGKHQDTCLKRKWVMQQDDDPKHTQAFVLKNG